MGKSIPSSAKLQDFARIITSDRTQQSKRIPKSLSNKTRVVPPPEPAKPKGVRIVHSEKQQQRLKIMDESSSTNRRIPLAEVVLECSRRWFQDTLKEAKAGDTSMQVLVGQMYCSGYGVVKDAQKVVKLGSVELPGVVARFGKLVISTQVTMLVTQIRMK
uniref:Uncharacterized protein n=1 Tax=Helianthus annuus TaxID=4232 RepID=A0A251U5I2_HELAN